MAQNLLPKSFAVGLSGIGVKTAYIEPGSPWENGFCESFNGTFRDNLLDGEIFYSLKEAQIIVGSESSTTTMLGPIVQVTDHQHPKPKCPNSSKINPVCCNDLL